MNSFMHKVKLRLYLLLHNLAEDDALFCKKAMDINTSHQLDSCQLADNYDGISNGAGV